MTNIRTSRKTGFILRNGVQRRQTRWIGLTEARNTLAAANTAVLVTTANAALLALRPFTIVRTRGVLLMNSDQSTATEDWQVTYGHAIVSEQAAAIGVTAVPTPNADRGSDLWYVYEEGMGQVFNNTNIGVFHLSRVYRFDSRAMRKVEDGQDLVSVAETGSLSDGVTIVAAGRFLIKLH